MLDIIMELGDNFSSSIQENLGNIFRSSEMNVSWEIANSIGSVLNDHFSFPFANQSSGSAKVKIKKATVQKAPKNWRDEDDDRISHNEIPGIPTSHVTDTLVVYCLGSDNLSSRLMETLVAVGKHRFKNVIFVTSKWDASVVTGDNTQRLLHLNDFRRAGSVFCFVLVSTSGISEISVI